MNKKGKYILLSIVILIIALFGINLFTSGKEPSEKQTRKNIEDFKFLLVKVLVMDKEGTPNDLKTDEIFKESKYLKDILYSSQQNLLLTEENDGYVLDLNNSVNNVILKNATDYTFAMNNNNGETIKDCKVENNKVIIPKTYYKGKLLEPVQMEMITRLSKKELRNLPVKVSINNMVTTTKTVSLMGESNVTNLSLFKGGKNSVKKSNIAVYVNSYDSESKIDNAFYELQSKTGNLTLKTPPIFLNKLIVKVNANIFTKIANMAIMDVEALYSSGSSPNEIVLNGRPSAAIQAGKWYKTNDVDVLYGDQMVEDTHSNLYYAWVFNEDRYPQTDGYNTISKSVWWKWIKDNTPQNNTSNWSWSDYFAEDKLDSPSTGHNVAYAQLPGVFYGGTGENMADYTTPYNLNINESELTDIWDQVISMSCVHVGETIAIPVGSKIPMWAYVFYRQNESNNSDGEMDVVLTTDESLTTQTIFGVVKYTWPGQPTDGYGYIKIKKSYDLDVNDSTNANFEAWKASSSGDCKSTFANSSKVQSDWDSDSNSYLIGYNTTNPRGVNNKITYGLWCVREKSDGIGTIDFYPDFTKRFTSNGETIYYKRVRVSPNAVSSIDDGTGTSSSGTSGSSSNTALNLEVINKSSCATVKKVDGDTGNTIEGVKFKLYEYFGQETNDATIIQSMSNCLKNNNCSKVREVSDVNSKTTSVAKTNNKGIATFKGLRSSDGTNTIRYFVVEIKPDNSDTEAQKYYDGNAYSTDKIHRLNVNSGAASTDCKINKITNYQQYYCLKVKKVDASSPSTILRGAKFKLTGNGVEYEHEDSWDEAKDSNNNDDGYTTFFLDSKGTSNYTLTETKAPTGYSASSSTIDVPLSKVAELQSNLTKAQAKAECKKTNAKDKDGNLVSSVAVVAENEKRVINWYKVNEKDENVDNAKFKVKSGTQYIKVEANKKDVTYGSTTKNCYVFDSLVAADSASEVVETNGEVCIAGVPTGQFTVIETRPADGYTFDAGENQKPISSGSTFASKTDSNTFINQPTYFEFEKTVIGEDEFTTLTTEELKKIVFNIYNSDNKKLCFIQNSDGIYEYKSVSNNDTCPTGQIKDLHVDDNRKIKVFRLPQGTYSIKEVGATIRDDGKCGCEGEDCTGYYSPKGDVDTTFTINSCNNVGQCTNKVGDANEKQCKNGGVGTSTQCTSETISKLAKNNTPTKLEFTKSDLYKYEDENEPVDFENEKERSDFDKIVFRLRKSKPSSLNPTYDESHKDEIYYKLLPVGDNGKCDTDEGYMEYRYVPDDMLEYLTEEQKNSMTYDLHTCGGHIHITHLCRGKTYYIEEVSVPEDSVFTLPETVNEKIKEHQIECCDETKPKKPSDTVEINDKGTRVRFEKRDSKYHYRIPDEETTFQVYRCPKNQTCNLNNYITFDSTTNKYVVSSQAEAAGIKLIKFADKAILNGDEEDPMGNRPDADEANYKVYRAIGDNVNVSDLHPDHGVLILRYLKAGYNYILLETKAPKNYRLPSVEKAQTSFTVATKLSEVEISDVANAPTSILIRKYDDNNNLLPGAQFKVYDTGTKCDATKSPMAQKENASQMNFKTIRDGIYESRPALDTDIIQTCNDLNGTCSSIPINVDTKVVYDGYSNEEGYEWTGLTDATTENGDRLEIKQGEALIQYLEYGHCYVIEEVKAPTGYSLPEKVEDRFTTIEIPENSRYAYDTYKTFINTPTPFTFYKYDEFGNPLDGAKFKLQKLDDDKKYRDLTVTKEEKNGEFYYKVDSNSTNKTIETKDGKATVYYLESGQYRILETSPAPGKQLGKNANVATFFVDDSGNVYGNSIIVNKGETSYIEIKGSSSAEYIISPRTGVKVVKYGLIIAVLVAIISGLMLLIKKMNKEEK